MTYKEIAKSAENIVIPKGRAKDRCVKAFEKNTDIEVPEIFGRKGWSISQGRKFWEVKGKDIPLWITFGMADIGSVGTDVCLDFLDSEAIRYKRIGDAMCRFSLLADKDIAKEIEEILTSKSRILSVPTSYPNMLKRLARWQNLPLTALAIPFTNSIENVANASGLGICADLVESGETARENDLVEVKRLCFVFPEIIAAVNS